jgi:hypothetical protein
MTFPSIDIQGSIISSDLPGKIRMEQATHQHGKDFVPGFTDARLKDEISLAWQPRGNGPFLKANWQD